MINKFRLAMSQTRVSQSAHARNCSASDATEFELQSHVRCNYNHALLQFVFSYPVFAQREIYLTTPGDLP